MDNNDYSIVANDSKIDPSKSNFPFTTTENFLNGSQIVFTNKPEEDEKIKEKLRNNEIHLKMIFGINNLDIKNNPNLLASKDSDKSSNRSEVSNSHHKKHSISDNKLNKFVKNIRSNVQHRSEHVKKKTMLIDDNKAEVEAQNFKSRKTGKVNFDTSIRKRSIVNQVLNEKLKAEIRRDQKRKSTIYTMIVAAQNRKKSIEFNPAAISTMITNSQKGTDYEHFQRKLKIYDIIIAVMVFLNIIFLISDNNLYIDKSNSYIEDYSTKNNITSNQSKLIKQ